MPLEPPLPPGPPFSSKFPFNTGFLGHLQIYREGISVPLVMGGPALGAGTLLPCHLQVIQPFSPGLVTGHFKRKKSARLAPGPFFLQPFILRHPEYSFVHDRLRAPVGRRLEGSGMGLVPEI